MLIFSPHPDDETLCCGGTILKAIQENKKVKVVFLTNGEASKERVSVWLKKEPGEIASGDYIALGEVRQKEALQAMKILGLSKEDAIFLGYPDTALFYLWEAKYKDFYKSEAIDTSASPFEKTYARARQGYTKENLLSDIKEILKEYKPRNIYTPYSLDTHKDHQVATYFVNLALRELMIEGKGQWVNSTKVYYYLIHSPAKNWPDLNSPILKGPDIFSQEPAHSENIANFKDKKAEALKTYSSQTGIEKERIFLQSFIKNNELFWEIPHHKLAYLKQLEEEWARIARIMKQQGYNVNLAPVVDVAGNSEDMINQLTRRQRVYSQDPDVVTDLAQAVIKGLTKAGITPVLKHFPGLGNVQTDTHIRLPKAEATKDKIYKRDLLPFKELIKKCDNIWIMVDHAIYSNLSPEPASLSYEIQTELLRKSLGFEGIIIVDELLNMQAISEFAYQQNIKQPHIGEIVVRVFQAGGDIALIYPPAGKAEEIASHIIQSVKEALGAGRLKQECIDDSVKRILKEKEKIFSRPLGHLFKEMTLEEKICQKIAIDTYKDIELFKRYNLAGMRARQYAVIEEAQEGAKIPMFIMAEHEGGLVNEYLLKLYTRSPYLIGKEFERLVVKAGVNVVAEGSEAGARISPGEPSTHLVDFNQLDRANLDEIVSSILDSIDELIGLWSEAKLKGNVVPHPNFLTPLTIRVDGRFEIKPFAELPIEWIKRFPGKEENLYAYQLVKRAFQSWPENQEGKIGEDTIITQLKSFKKHVKNLTTQSDKSGLRVLCIATHPDDEDGEALVYFKKKFNCSTYILLATRGEGGKNKISPLLDKELGVLRTEEIERAASLLGVKKVYYLGKNDFGYSVDPNEAFQIWGKQDTLEKLVYFIRLIKPHIIITKHNKFDNRDHGQHRALALLTEEAFDLAGDSKAYPKITKLGIKPWQPIKFYRRSTIAEEASEDKSAEIDSGEYIFSEDKTIRKIALEALKQHQSQGDWEWIKTEKPRRISYQLVKSKIDSGQEGSFFAGIGQE